jgi:uncharacterized protein involved in oxidation of intracellular sulfur
MRALVVINDPPYGTERAYNALRLAYAMSQRDDTQVRVFLIGDGASCARSGQTVPNGYYNIERLLKAVARRGGEVGVCGTCMDARGIADADLLEGAYRGSMDQLTAWTVDADKVLTF